MMKVPKQTSTFIWDLDGTLINSLGVFAEVLADILPAHNYSVPSLEVIARNHHGSLDDSINTMLGGVSSKVLAALVQDFLKAQNHHYELVDQHIFPDALRLAKRAHKAGIIQILVTNRDHAGRMNASPRNIVQNSKLHGLIDVIICGDDSRHRKPKPEVLGSQKIVPETTLVIGDQFVDGEFAMNLDARGLLVAHDAKIPHLTKLGDGWQQRVTIVQSFDEVQL